MPNIIINPKFRKFINKQRILNSINAVIDAYNPERPQDLTIKISDDLEIQELNKVYRGIDSPTDVLSFNNDHLDLDNGNYYLGDVIISYPTAEEQAREAGCDISDEIELLVVHGCLHLFGYDHLVLTEKHVMWQIQRSILSNLGNPIAFEKDFK
ncbi:MAG: rRNA maturation RNase YbeY [Anaerolineaceae bacterium]|nr:rRNA maturation RNase YbeY [Anaerolineaceae bacterium]